MKEDSQTVVPSAKIAVATPCIVTGYQTGEEGCTECVRLSKQPLSKNYLSPAINERLVKLRFVTNTKNRFVTIIGAYATTMSYDDNAKEGFHAQQSQLIRESPKEDQLMTLGDFNARVGANHESWPEFMGAMALANAIAMACCS